MRIALDAMGTDGAPATEVSGALAALRKFGSDFRVVLVGDEERIRVELNRHGDPLCARIDVVHAPDRITGADSPASVVRRRPNSSIVVGLRLQKNGEADAFVSAGSTGAVMASSLFILRALPGVDRPALGTLLPTAGEPVLLVDSGANVDCKPHHLLQFAQLGQIYARDLMGISNPRIGLLNIGEEAEKGDELTVETYRLLSAAPLNFLGNVEGRAIIRGGHDILVCDGFVGNVLLKFYEAVAEVIVGMLRTEVARSKSSLDLEGVFTVLDYAEYGGAPLLGVDGVAIVCHGTSTVNAIRNAIGVATAAVRSEMVVHIAGEMVAIPNGEGA